MIAMVCFDYMDSPFRRRRILWQQATQLGLAGVEATGTMCPPLLRAELVATTGALPVVVLAVVEFAGAFFDVGHGLSLEVEARCGAGEFRFGASTALTRRVDGSTAWAYHGEPITAAECRDTAFA